VTPTYEAPDAFAREFAKLTPEQRARFRKAVAQMVEDLLARRPFRPSLRVKRVQGTAEVWEMTWAPDGRATWHYGSGIQPGVPHIVWRRIGTHSILNRP
jgi:hypothetical protein